jgi:hypothetical protein
LTDRWSLEHHPRDGGTCQGEACTEQHDDAESEYLPFPDASQLGRHYEVGFTRFCLCIDFISIQGVGDLFTIAHSGNDKGCDSFGL